MKTRRMEPVVDAGRRNEIPRTLVFNFDFISVNRAHSTSSRAFPCLFKVGIKPQ